MKDSTDRSKILLLQYVVGQIQALRNSRFRSKSAHKRAAASTEEPYPAACLKSSPFPQPSFHKFTSLPCELRLQIWELAVFTPRVVEVRNISRLKRYRDASGGPPFQAWYHSCGTGSAPESLRICRETREIALKRYVFSTGEIRLYLDPAIDTLYFGKYCNYASIQIVACYAAEMDLRMIRTMAVDEAFLSGIGAYLRNESSVVPSKPFIGPAFAIFTGLESLIVILGQSMDYATRLKKSNTSKHCNLCEYARCHVGILSGWQFPTYQHFVRTDGPSVNEDAASEAAYKLVLSQDPCTRFGWLWEYLHTAYLHSAMRRTIRTLG